MFKKKELTRLGDILVSKGLITPEQLASAIQEQSKRKLLLDPTDANAKVAPIGEILIELGFIDQLQLKRGLNWQQRLRHASIAMALCAPFMMFAPSAAASVVRPAPITIEAENYAAMLGVLSENTTDVGGGKNIGGTSDGDWMTYNIDVPATGNYKITYRVASFYSTSKFVLRSGDDVDLAPVIAVPNTGGWQVWKDVEQIVALTKGPQTLKIFAKSGGFNLNWFTVESVSDSVVVASSSSAFSSSSSSLSSSSSSATTPVTTTFPFVIQAETYSSMYGVVKETTTDVGGGQSLGYIDTGDWISYSKTVLNAPFSGKYKFSYRVASLKGGANLVLSDIGSNTTLDTVSIPVTGGWQTWQTIEREVELSEGEHTFNLLAKTGGVNINWIQIQPVAVPTALTIQAENYAKMSGVINETTTDIGGGKNIGYFAPGDWMSYDNAELTVPNAGSYKVTYRLASNNNLVKFELYDLDTGAVIDTVPVPNTAGWQSWVDLERTIKLPVGKKRFGIRSTSGSVNLNWFKFEPINNAGKVISDIYIPPSSAASSSLVSSSVSSSSSSPAAVSSSSSSKAAVSSSSMSSSSAVSAQPVAGPVGLSWTPPDKRENGNYLDIADLGGYEIRYKKTTDTKYTYISINDPWTNTYQFEWLDGSYVFQIAAFDKNGIYSPFVDIHKQ